MPDWSYQTLFRPLFFALPAEHSRMLALGAIGTLARLPTGPKVIDLMGHMTPPGELSRSICDMQLASPIGLGAGLDIHLQATAAFERFGFGFLEIGPVTLQPIVNNAPISRMPAQQAIMYPEPLANPGLLATLRQLDKLRPSATPLMGCIGHKPGATPRDAAMEQIFLIQSLSTHCAWFTLDTRFTIDGSNWGHHEWKEYMALLKELHAKTSNPPPLFLCVPPDLDDGHLEMLLPLAMSHGFHGIQIAGGVSVQRRGRLFGKPVFEQTQQLVQQIRERLGNTYLLIASGGVIEPEQALVLLSCGADLITLHSGLVYSGPGLPKRINEAILAQVEDTALQPERPALARDDARIEEKKEHTSVPRWLSGVLLGLGMIVSGFFAWIVALTEVLLPYDEAFLGITRQELHQINHRLLHFLSHDRISLAGTMISIKVIYVQLARRAIRRNEHWARQILLASGVVGFASLFYFFGFGYFDPVHALLSLFLLPFFLHTIWKKPSAPIFVPFPDLRNDQIWHRGLWGQLSFVIIGCGLLGAGIIISIVGMSRVFVPEDLSFMQTSAELLQAAHPRLIPLIAHDRAGFGGALAADGIAVLLMSLWGFRRGSRWIWWTLACAGVPGFVSGVGIHFMVGYVDWWHLFPAYVAIAVFVAGLWSSYPYLCARKKAG